MTLDALKPCPFCGGPAHGGWFATEYNIACETSGCPGNTGASVYARNPSDAMQARAVNKATFLWNTRAGDTE